MNKREAGLVMMLAAMASTSVLANIVIASASKTIFMKCLELKNDNIKLLRTTVDILDNVDDLTDIPEELLTDIRFRSMAYLTEAEMYPRKKD